MIDLSRQNSLLHIIERLCITARGRAVSDWSKFSPHETVEWFRLNIKTDAVSRYVTLTSDFDMSRKAAYETLQPIRNCFCYTIVHRSKTDAEKIKKGGYAKLLKTLPFDTKLFRCPTHWGIRSYPTHLLRRQSRDIRVPPLLESRRSMQGFCTRSKVFMQRAVRPCLIHQNLEFRF